MPPPVGGQAAARTALLLEYRRQQPPPMSILHVDLRSHVAVNQVVAGELMLRFLDDAPPWVPSHWDTTFELGYVPTPNSKARGLQTRRPTERTARAAISRKRTGEVFSVGFTYMSGTDDDGMTFLTCSWGRIGSGFEVWASGVPATSLNDPEVGHWVARAATRAVSALPDMGVGCAWWGHGSTPPYSLAPVQAGQVPGYTWMLTLPPDVAGRVGDPSTSPAAIVEAARDPNGQDHMIMVLTEAPDQATDDVLIAWREYLRPVLPDNYRTSRTEMFMRSIDQFPWQFDVPPMILADDWPEWPATDVEVPPSAPPDLPSLGMGRPLPRVDTSAELRFAWRVRPTGEQTPILTQGLGVHLAVLGGELVPADHPDAVDIPAVPSPRSDRLERSNGRHSYDWNVFMSHWDDWDIIDGVLWTAFPVTQVGGPFVVSTNSAGKVVVRCGTCRTRKVGSGAHGMLAHHTCADP